MNPFLGEIRMFGFAFAPTGWALCQGQIIPIQQNPSLFKLLGTYFGGDGITNFGLPNLQARLAIGPGQGQGSTYYPGLSGGVASVALTSAQLGVHDHALYGSSDVGTSPSSSGNVLARAKIGGRGQAGTDGLMYSSNPTTTALSASSLNAVGGNGAHNNLQPFVVVNYCIALSGLFPRPPELATPQPRTTQR